MAAAAQRTSAGSASLAGSGSVGASMPLATLLARFARIARSSEREGDSSAAESRFFGAAQHSILGAASLEALSGRL